MLTEKFKLADHLNVSPKDQNWKNFPLETFLNKEFEEVDANNRAEFDEIKENKIAPYRIENFCNVVVINGLVVANLSDALPSELKNKYVNKKLHHKNVASEEDFLKTIGGHKTSILVDGGKELNLNLIFLYTKENTAHTSSLNIKVADKSKCNIVVTTINKAKGSLVSRFDDLDVCPQSLLNFSSIYILEEDSFNVVHSFIKVGDDAILNNFDFCVESGFLKRKIDVFLSKRSEANLSGVNSLRNRGVAGMNIATYHEGAASRSVQKYSNVIGADAISIFNGLIKVNKNTENVKAEQKNKNLLLTNTSKAFSSPRLEIDNDNVECAHGVTFSQLPLDELFYLQSRGLNERIALKMISYGFLRSMIDQLINENVKEKCVSLLNSNYE